MVDGNRHALSSHRNMVVNGATKYKDMKHFDNVLQEFKSAGKDVGYEYFHERQLIALQGTRHLNPSARVALMICDALG